MKRLQNFYLYSYRLTGFIFLMGLIASILWYGFSVLFFLGSSSWSVPYILSPNQENVLVHQEHMLNVRQELLKETTALETARNTLMNKQVVLKEAEEIQLRIEKSVVQQVRKDTQNSKIYRDLTHEKAASIAELNTLSVEIRDKEATVAKELKIGLITKEEAISQRLALSNLRMSLVEAKARMHELDQRSNESNASARTFNGSATSLEAMERVAKKVELSRQIVQLKSEIYSLKADIKHLEEVLQKRAEVLAIMKQSPYILATKNPVHVAFVPYKNLRNVNINAPVYACYLDIILCYQAGHITQIYPAEEYAKHPLFNSDLKGEFVGITYHDAADAQRKLLFINAKPLFI